MSTFRAMNLDTVDWSKITIGNFEDLDPSNKKEVAALNMYQQYKAKTHTFRCRRQPKKSMSDLPNYPPLKILTPMSNRFKKSHLPLTPPRKKNKKRKSVATASRKIF